MSRHPAEPACARAAHPLPRHSADGAAVPVPLLRPPGFRTLAMPAWPSATADGLGLGLCALAVALAGLLLLLVPQRLAQRPGSEGVLTLHLAADGSLRLWNQPIRATDLQPLLRRAQRRSPSLRLRVLPEADVPWGSLQTLVRRLEAPGRQLELQLP